MSKTCHLIFSILQQSSFNIERRLVPPMREILGAGCNNQQIFAITSTV
jgi:hypothetical protein